MVAECVTGAVTPAMIRVVYDLNNFIVLAARVPQIYQNFQVSIQAGLAARTVSLVYDTLVICCVMPQSKSTGQLSGTVYAANFLGCIARIFTSLQEGGGYAMVRGFLLGDVPCPPAFGYLVCLLHPQVPQMREGLHGRAYTFAECRLGHEWDPSCPDPDVSGQCSTSQEESQLTAKQFTAPLKGACSVTVAAQHVLSRTLPICQHHT